MAKLVLRNSLEIRELQAGVFKVLMVSKSDDIIQAGLEGTRSFNDRAKELREAKKVDEIEKLGSQHAQCWINMVGKATELASGQNKETLQRYGEGVDTIEQVAEKVHICKVKKAFDKNKVKLYLAVHSSIDPVMEAVIRTLQSKGARLMKSSAPKSGHEHTVQELLDKLEGVVKLDGQ
eukprot:14334540-Alexandrium_andersonii.AAC.1